MTLGNSVGAMTSVPSLLCLETIETLIQLPYRGTEVQLPSARARRPSAAKLCAKTGSDFNRRWTGIKYNVSHASILAILASHLIKDTKDTSGLTIKYMSHRIGSFTT